MKKNDVEKVGSPAWQQLERLNPTINNSDLKKINGCLSTVSEADIKRNLRLVEEGKALDLPLVQLDGVMKHRFFSREWVRTKEGKEYRRAYQKTEKYKIKYKIWRKTYNTTEKCKVANKKYYNKNKVEKQAYTRAYYWKNKTKNLNEVMQK